MSELSEAISEMRNMRESYDQIAGAAEAYNVGKTELAAAITGKGVETSPMESYPEMAEKVNAISQETYEINGGEMYAKQLFGSLETPNYWNLYEIMAQLLSDGRLVNYGGILLAEYYKGHDSLALSGAGAGGAYVVSDKDSDGNFIMYINDTTHTWATEFDGKGNRWVAYCFANDGHDFSISNANLCPRSIYIGRNVGTITYDDPNNNGRVSKIIVPDGNTLKTFNSNIKEQNWDRDVVIRNLQLVLNTLIYNPKSESVYIHAKDIESSIVSFGVYGADWSLRSLIIECDRMLNGSCVLNTRTATKLSNLSQVVIKANSIDTLINGPQGLDNLNTLNPLFAILSENVRIGTSNFSNTSTCRMYFGYISNDKTKTVEVYGFGGSGAKVTNIELQDGWCKPLNISVCTALTKSSVQGHIFDRLGVNDISTGTVTVTLASAVLALFTQEEIDAVVERTNITIVGA